MLRCFLVHLSYNMWYDYEEPPEGGELNRAYYSPYLRFEEPLWRELLTRMKDAGMNMVILDLGDGVQYQSHPEIAVQGAWSVDKLKRELDACRAHGLEPIPKLNFATAHDAWLGEYSRKVSTREYYAVCADLIREVAAIFDGPRFVHLGMDEEVMKAQEKYVYAVVRQGQLWWNDLRYLAEQVERAGARAWVWGDALYFKGEEEFTRNMPRTVVQSYWTLGTEFEEVNRFLTILDQHGYSQIPAGSMRPWALPENYPLLVENAVKTVSPSNLLGFVMSSWRPTLAQYREDIFDALEVASRTHRSRGDR